MSNEETTLAKPATQTAASQPTQPVPTPAAVESGHGSSRKSKEIHDRLYGPIKLESLLRAWCA